MKRREFIQVAVGAAGAVALPAFALVPESYDCDCGLVRYTRQAEGHFAASHLKDGRRFTYQLFCWHNQIHRKMAADKQSTARPVQLTLNDLVQMRDQGLNISREDFRSAFLYENKHRNFSACFGCGAKTFEQHGFKCSHATVLVRSDWYEEIQRRNDYFRLY